MTERAPLHRAQPVSRHDRIRLAVLISGSGTTLQNLSDKVRAGQLRAEIATVICSNPAALEKATARNLGVTAHLVHRRQFADTAAFSEAIWRIVRDADVDLVCLAGFLSLIDIPDDFAYRVLNIHPALLPSFGGQGMHGRHVHEAVLAAGCKVSGCTVHFADPTYDTGPILVQRTCPVLDEDTPDALAARVFEQECLAYPAAIQLIAEGRVVVAGRRTRVLPGDPLPTEADEQLVRAAAKLCLEAHAGQRRDGGRPYSEHPISVAQTLRRRGVQDAAVIAAAYLHDTVEDTDVTTDDLRRQFGSTVADLVAQMTLSDQEQASFDVKTRALQEHARKMTPDARLIKLADRLDNLRDLHTRPPEKQKRYAEATLGLLDALSPWPPAGDAMAEEIRRLVGKFLHE
jgi:phosphoribosylglycinamide formyltransferase-1